MALQLTVLIIMSPDEGEVDLCGTNVTTLPAGKWTKLRKEQIGFILKSSASAVPESRRAALGAAENKPLRGAAAFQ